MEELSEIRERLARLEEHQQIAVETQKQMMKTLTDISEELTRYKGFLGGIVFLATAFVAFLGMLKGWVVFSWKGGG